MTTRIRFPYRFVNPAFTILTLATAHFSQNRPGPAAPPADDSILGSYGLYLGILAIGGLIAAAVFMRKREAAVKAAPAKEKKGDGFVLKEKSAESKAAAQQKAEVRPRPERKPKAEPANSVLPVYTFIRLYKSNSFIQLPESHDPSLLEAIERTNEESEEDAQVRTQALKLLASFRTSNAVAAISQMALYDLSSKLRSDAVGLLAEINHESVFEPIVTACADPTREVRAAAARALFKLTFDRAQAWTRPVDSGDTARMRHVARCAIEGDLVMRSFDRLTHVDQKIAYEAFAMTALLIKSGETELIYKALAEHKDENVKLALLHVLQTIKSERTYDELSDLLTKSGLTPNVAAKVNEVRSMLQLVNA